MIQSTGIYAHGCREKDPSPVPNKIHKIVGFTGEKTNFYIISNCMYTEKKIIVSRGYFKV